MKNVKLIITFILVTSKFSSFAQIDTLTNLSIIELQQNKFTKSFIITKIDNSICNFELSTQKLIELKKAKVPEDVINEMLKKASKPKVEELVSIPKKMPAVSKIDKPKSDYKPPTNLSSGIYYHNKLTNELNELDASVYSQAKTSSGILTSITYGFAKSKAKSVLTGTTANLEISDSLPVFYFYFDKNRTNDLGGTINTVGWVSLATTPNEFTLTKLVVTKNGTREVVTGTSNIQGETTGVAEEQYYKYKYEKVAPGIYKVFFPNGIKPGQYCFMYAGNGETNKVYDFGISK